MPTSTHRAHRYGDTHVIRALARSLRHQGHQVEQEADLLLRAVGSTAWTGRAAQALQASANAGAQALHRTAALHVEAAEALLSHADEVDRLAALIERVETAVLAAVTQARSRLQGLAGLAEGVAEGVTGGLAVGLAGGLAGALPDPVDELMDRFDPPPCGHRDWLSTHVGLPMSGLGSLLDGSRA